MLKQWANNNRDRIMNKHEVIEILWDGLKAASHYGENYVNGINVAEQLYARIAPEFSEETDFEVRSILAEFSTVTAMTQDEAVEKIKHLFGGQVAGLNLDRGLIDSKEFPEEAAIQALLKIKGPETGSGLHWYTGRKEALADLKRLWEGTEKGARLETPTEPIWCNKEGTFLGKGGCPTCGGKAGHVCYDGVFRKWTGLLCSNCGSKGGEHCPDCGGTGERRKEGMIFHNGSGICIVAC
ncbi:hypothetical protein LCGC14_3157820 [marine sediment metagenome]|uniref:Uncharacterized protein n=1 Tax=marine sediment metagenome TaxID=412755 RepID=A0A0F8XYY3_9ZZZZ